MARTTNSGGLRLDRELFAELMRTASRRTSARAAERRWNWLDISDFLDFGRVTHANLYIGLQILDAARDELLAESARLDVDTVGKGEREVVDDDTVHTEA